MDDQDDILHEFRVESYENSPMSTPHQRWDADLYDDSHAFVWRHGASLVELLDPKAGERILDLGCGTGHLTARIAARGANVVGLDHSAEMLAEARTAYPALQFIQGDARDFSLPTPFDAVFSNAVLHWIKPPEAAARCVFNALRPGGRFVAELGGHGNLRRVEAAMSAALEKTGVRSGGSPMYFPRLSEYATVLETAGLEVRSALLFDRPTPLEGDKGFRNWVEMFGRWAMESVPDGRSEDFLSAAEDAARPELYRDGGWYADYRRLRVVAYRPTENGERGASAP